MAVRSNNLIHQVYDVAGENVIVGFDKDGQKVRETVSVDDIKSAEDYQNILLKRMGLGALLGVRVQGRRAKLWDKTRFN